MFRKILKKLSLDEIVSVSSPLFIGFMITNVLNYLYCILLGKILFDESSYGEFSALNQFSYYFIIPISAITLISSKLVAEWYARDEKEKINYFIKQSLKVLFAIFIITTIIGIALTPIIQKFLQLKSPTSWLIILFYMTIGILSPTLVGAVSGLHKFKWQAILQVIGALARFILGIIFTVSLGVIGAVAGNLIVSIVNIIFGMIIFRMLTQDIKDEKIFKINFPWKLLVGSIFSTLAFGSFLSTDIVFVKHYLTGNFIANATKDIPTIYSMISMFGRIVYFLALTFATALVPLSSFARVRGKSHQRILFQILFIDLVVTIPLVLSYFLFPEFLIGIIYDASYLPGAKFLGLYGLSVFFYAISGIFSNYFISINKSSFAVIPSFFALVQIILALNFHDSITDFINIQILVNLLTLIILIIYWFFFQRNKC